MRTLFYECFSGIAGDMHLGALLDLGVPENVITSALATLPMRGEFTLHIDKAGKRGITGTRVRVALAPDHERPARHLKDVEAVIASADLSSAAQDLAYRIFRIIAEAEARVHGIDIGAVHFHEVGATDSLVDIISAAVAIDTLQPEAIYCAPLELGSGMVRCEHGLMPVPAPATANILNGIACTRGGVVGEATTPTGAAILKAIVTDFQPPSPFRTDRIGYGVGHRDFERPNVLRVSLGDSGNAGKTGLTTEADVELTCNLDDMSPEAFAPLTSALQPMVKDFFITPVLMKKGRPGHQLTLLLPASGLDATLSVLFRESSTIGARVSAVTQYRLPRRSQAVPTRHGEVSVKIVELPDGTRRWKVEHDTVVAAAAGRYQQVRREVETDVAAWFEARP